MKQDKQYFHSAITAQKVMNRSGINYLQKVFLVFKILIIMALNSD